MLFKQFQSTEEGKLTDNIYEGRTVLIFNFDKGRTDVRTTNESCL